MVQGANQAGRERASSGPRDSRSAGDRGSVPVMIRGWQSGDVVQVSGLLDEDEDPLWVSQFHGLHGQDEDGPRWRRTLVAIDHSGRVVGCATVAVNQLHSSRFPCAIDVAPDRRHRGIGGVLLTAIKQQRPYVAPLSTKVRPLNVAAQSFIANAGGTVYQRCAGAVIDPADPYVARWADNQATNRCASFSGQSAEALTSAFAEQYRWVHQRWSPVKDSAVLQKMAAEEIAEIDPAVSAGTWSDGRLVAAAFAFPVAIGFEVVAETVVEDHPQGVDVLGEAIAAVVRAAGRQGALLKFDGHISDPHLHPVISTLPWCHSEPLDLMEVR